MDTLRFFWGCFCLSTGITLAKGASVSAGDDQVTTLGSNQFTLTCRYTTEVGETPDSMTIRHKRFQSSEFIELFKFNIPANTSSYVDDSLISKAQFSMNENSVSVTYSSADCNDNGSYQCKFDFLRNEIIAITRDEMQLTVESQPEVPVMTQSSSDYFTESETVEFVCSSYIGPRDRSIAWFGFSEGNNLTDLTNLANQSDPIQNKSGPRFCIFKRTSELRITLSRKHNGMNFRCGVVSPDDLGDQSASCDPSVCTSSPDINVQYGIRQEDLILQSDPRHPANKFEVGSSVTLRCDVDGNPEPYFKWVKGEDQVIREGSNQLTLENLNLEDSGIYRCYGNNTVGETTYEAEREIGITVVLITTPTPTPTPTPTTNSGVIGEVKKKEPQEGLAMVTIIVIICAAVFLIIIIIIIICCCCCRKGKSNKNRNEIRMNNSPPGKSNLGFEKPSDGAVENSYILAREPSRSSKGPDVLRHTGDQDGRRIHAPEEAIDGRFEPAPVDLSRGDIQFVAGPGALSRPRSRYPVVLDDYDADLHPTGHYAPTEYMDLDRHSGYLNYDRRPSDYVDMEETHRYGNVRRNSNDSGVNLDAGYSRPDMMFV